MGRLGLGVFLGLAINLEPFRVFQLQPSRQPGRRRLEPDL